jgi:hypothetical protein
MRLVVGTAALMSMPSVKASIHNVVSPLAVLILGVPYVETEHSIFHAEYTFVLFLVSKALTQESTAPP